MIEQWIFEDERELEARCARFRAAQLALGRPGNETDDEPATVSPGETP
jgi:hypothetical protein